MRLLQSMRLRGIIITTINKGAAMKTSEPPLSEPDAHTFPYRWRTAKGWSFSEFKNFQNNFVHHSPPSTKEFTMRKQLSKITHILSILLIGVIGVQTIFTLSCSNDGGSGGSGSSSGSNGGADISSGSGGGTSKADCIREALGISAYTLNDIAAECEAKKSEVLSQLPSTFGTCEAKDLDFDKTIKKIKEECGVEEIPIVSSSSSSKGDVGGSSSSSGGGSSSGSGSSSSNRSSSSSSTANIPPVDEDLWYAYTVGNAYLDNEITGSDGSNTFYKIINADGNAELKIKSINQTSFAAYAAAALNLSIDYYFDISKCSSGFSYSFKGPGHRFALELNCGGDSNYTNFYADIGLSGYGVGEYLDWNTHTVTKLTRDTYTAGCYNGDGTLKYLLENNHIRNFSWVVRSNGADSWSISNKTLEVADFKCIP
jgi:hypothetical protein